MPSARPSNFKGAAGILRDVDGTIVSLEFTDQNPLWTGEKPGKKSTFRSLFAVFGIRVDGSEDVSIQPVWVGDADAFGITDDKMGLIGGELSKGSSFFVLLDSISKTEFDEANYIEDAETETANWGALVGARFRFNWAVDERATQKYGKKVSKKDPKKSYDRENLIVTNYYGQVEVDEAPAPVAAKKPGLRSATPPASAAKPLGTKPAAKGKTAVSVEDTAKQYIIEAISSKKGKPLSKSKLSVMLLNALNTVDPQLRTDVRTWANDNENLSDIDGVIFNAETAELTLDATE